MKNWVSQLAFIVVSGAFLTACGASRINKIEKGQSAEGEKPFLRPTPDYGFIDYWAAHPEKWDPSDSVPEPYKTGHKTDISIDVFFVHPTTYTNSETVNGVNAGHPLWNAALDDEALNLKTDNSTILNQASAFNIFSVYAPYYQQAHIKAFGLNDTLAKPIFDKAYADVAAAFDYYLQHDNKGKPFIIASHSQGTVHAARLLKEKIENTPLQKQLVAAYIIGMAVPVNYFAALQPCDKPDATGCVIGWRTFKKGFVPENVKAEQGEKLVINPLTFDADKTSSSRKASKGAVLYKFNKPKARNVATEVHDNILWSSKPRFFGNIFFTRKNYHIGDINLFWKDIRENAALRVNAYHNR